MGCVDGHTQKHPMVEDVGHCTTLAVSVLAVSVRSGQAGHVDSRYAYYPNTRFYFFEDYTTNQVKWRPCDQALTTFGLTPNIALATDDWETTHGYGIDYYNNGTCGSIPLGFRTFSNQNQCGVPPQGSAYAACWFPELWQSVPEAWSYVGGCCVAATKSSVWVNTLWIDAQGFSEGIQTFILAHELGHAMALEHHSPCQTVMALGACLNTVETSDVLVPRCMYAYTC